MDEKKYYISRKLTTILVYSRPPLVFCGMLCAIGVMLTRNSLVYFSGVLFLFISMGFDLVDGWFAARFHPGAKLANLADRLMDKVVYSIIFPLVAVGSMWRLIILKPAYTRAELLHGIFILLLCVTVLVRDNFAHFMRGFAINQGQEPEPSEFTRLRTIVAAPVGALLYAYVFYIPGGPSNRIYEWIAFLGNLPLRFLFFIEITFLVINFGSIAGYCRKYGTFCLDELCLGDTALRRRILTFFPNALTVMNAMMGLLAVFFAYQGRIREAYFILIGAALFDKLDGAVARKLGLVDPPNGASGTNRISLGGILDDISDAVSFCIVPAWIFFIVISEVTDPVIAHLPAAFIAWLFALMGLLRLLYFTMDKKPIPGFFKGLPTPAAALFVAAPLVMLNQAISQAPEEVRFWGIFCFGLMIFTALLMNFYPIRYLHFGRFMNRHPLFSITNLFIVFVLLFTPYFGHFCFLYMVLYVLSPVWTWRIKPEIAALERRVEKR